MTFYDLHHFKIWQKILRNAVKLHYGYLVSISTSYGLMIQNSVMPELSATFKIRN